MGFGRILVGVIYIFLVAGCANNISSTAPVVELKQNDQREYRLYIDDKEFYVKGAGLEFGSISDLAANGANSFITWRTEKGQKTALEMLDLAHENGLMVLMGLEIGRERHGFDYNDPVWVQEQKAYIRDEVMRLKDHPALLAWGIGSELNLEAENLKVWDAVNDISKMIHEIDPYHPTTTILAGIHKRDIYYMAEHCSNLDFLSIHSYDDIVNLKQQIDDAGYEGPYILTRGGSADHWEVPQTEWGAAIEQTSQQKALSYMEFYKKAILLDSTNCMGSYVFLWGQKQGFTPTCDSMFLENESKTEIVDAMYYMWNGTWPEDRSPTIDTLLLNGKDAYQSIRLNIGNEYEARAAGRSFDDDELTYSWEIIPERTHLKTGGAFENRPETLLYLDGNQVHFNAPEKSGAYRLFVYITDSNGNAATGNIPFYVE